MAGQGKNEDILFSREGYDFPYFTRSPDQSWEMPKKLVEISGLGYIDTIRLACVQDEKGSIFIYNTQAGEIESKIEFWDDGDYEGIDVVGNDAWVIKSNGQLFRIKDFLSEEGHTVKKYKTGLSKRNEPEGLAFDRKTNRLLIPCKGYPSIDDDSGSAFKAIYSFDTESKKLQDKPAFIISLDTIKVIKNFNTMTRIGLNVLSTMDKSKGDVTFQPSGMAVHPLTGDLYIIGAVGNLIVVLDRENAFLAAVELKSSQFEQPEGICFSPEGDLYIASEGKDDKGTIQAFRMK